MCSYGIYPSPLRDFRTYNEGKRTYIRTTQDFIDKSVYVWGDGFDYSGVIFVNRSTQVLITCKVHDYQFKICPRAHFESSMGGGCPKCIEDEVRKKRKYGRKRYIEQFIEAHGDLYDYSEFVHEPNNQKESITISCNTCGTSFQCEISNHIQGHGCPVCRYVKSSNATRWSTDKFIEESNKVHMGRYDYSESNYITYNTKLTVICRSHGSFLVTPGNHISRKSGCPTCSKERSTFNRMTSEDGITLYVIKMYNESEEFYKIGITSKPSVSDRFNTLPSRGGYEIEEVIHTLAPYEEIVSLERRLHDLHHETKYSPESKFNGHTECFHTIDMDIIESEITNLHLQ